MITWVRRADWTEILLASLIVMIIVLAVYGVFSNMSKYEQHKVTCDKKQGELITNAAGAYVCIERGILK